MSGSPVNQWENKRLIKDQLTQIKLLSNDLLIKEEEISILKEKAAEFEDMIMEYEEKIEIISQELILIERESNIKEDESMEKINSLSLESQELSTQLNVKRSENDHLMREIEVYRETLRSTETKNLYLEGEIQSLKEQCSIREENVKRQRGKFKNLKEKAKFFKEENRELRLRIDEITRDLENIKAHNDQVIADQDRNSQEIEEFVKEFKELEERSFYLEKENSSLNSHLEELKGRNEILQKEITAQKEAKSMEESMAKINETNLERLKAEVVKLKEEREKAETLNSTLSTQLESMNSETKAVEIDLKSLHAAISSHSKCDKLPFKSKLSEELSDIFSKWQHICKKRRHLKSDYKRLMEEKNAITDSIKEINQRQLELQANAQGLKSKEREKLESLQREMEFQEESWKNAERNLLETIFSKEQEIERLQRLTDDYHSTFKKNNEANFDIDSFLVNFSVLSCAVASLYKALLTLSFYKGQLSKIINPILYIYFELLPCSPLRKFRGVVFVIIACNRLRMREREKECWTDSLSKDLRNTPFMRILRWAKVEPINLSELEKVVNLGFSSDCPIYTANYIFETFSLNARQDFPYNLEMEGMFRFYEHLLEEHQIIHEREHSNEPVDYQDQRLLHLKNDIQTEMLTLQRKNKELMKKASRKKHSSFPQAFETAEHLFTLDNEEEDFE